MSQLSFYKSFDVLVLRSENEDDLLLIQRGTKNAIHLDQRASSFWRDWKGGPVRNETELAIAASLSDAGMVFEDESPSPLPAMTFDNEVPQPAGPHIKSYQETPGLTVVFNTRKPQIFTLAEAASLCWQLILKRQTVGQIGSEILRTFRRDVGPELVSIFAEYELIDPIDGLAPSERADLRHQFFIPAIEYWLPHAKVPWTCDWELNTVCNLRCKHCYLPHHKAHGTSAGSALDTCQQLIDLGTPIVELLGGEVLLRTDLEQIVTKLSAANVYVSAISNGTLMTAERARGLAAAGLSRIMFSLDGLDQQTHDACRGEGTFVKTLEAIKVAQAAGIGRVQIIWTTHGENFADLPRLPDFLDSIGVTGCCIDLFKKTGILGGKSGFTPLTREQIVAAKATIAGWQSSHRHIWAGFEPECTCGRTRLTIGADRSVRTCTFDSKANGNLDETTLTEIWAANRDGYSTAGPIGYCKAG
jgi:MoaA/NifB/PqqE/SkfB family radical SAM enzyme